MWRRGIIMHHTRDSTKTLVVRSTAQQLPPATCHHRRRPRHCCRLLYHAAISNNTSATTTSTTSTRINKSIKHHNSHTTTLDWTMTLNKNKSSIIAHLYTRRYFAFDATRRNFVGGLVAAQCNDNNIDADDVNGVSNRMTPAFNPLWTSASRPRDWTTAATTTTATRQQRTNGMICTTPRYNDYYYCYRNSDGSPLSHWPLLKQQSIRSYSSSNHDRNKEEPTSTTSSNTATTDTSTTPPPTTTSENSVKGTDPDFTSYLTGGAPASSSSSSSSVPFVDTTTNQLGLDAITTSALLVKQRRMAAAVSSANRKRSRTMALFDTNHCKELYKQISDAQILQKEQSRRKTATNVYRALIGNVVICSAKFAAWLSSGSSAMLAEFIHSVVDCGNQSLLLIGLRDSNLAADRAHPYGYGKSIYFWALVSALGTFFLGAGVSMTHAIGDLLDPSLHQITWEVWTVLLLSFGIDGYVLQKTIHETLESKPVGVSYWQHVMTIRDPATLAVLLEDGAACLGIVFAIAGITASHYTGNPIFDGIAGVGISALLGAMGIALVRVNHRFLLGQGVDREIIDDIGKILISQRSIDSIRSIQSQWTGPETFSYKAEVDFDGTYLAAKLMPIYQQEFLQIKNSMDEELQVLLALYAEDVMRTVEREVRQVEAQIRQKYPGAEYIELEPMSMDADRLAIDDNVEAELRRVESDALNRFLKSLKSEAAVTAPPMPSTTDTNPSSK